MSRILKCRAVEIVLHFRNTAVNLWPFITFIDSDSRKRTENGEGYITQTENAASQI